MKTVSMLLLVLAMGKLNAQTREDRPMLVPAKVLSSVNVGMSRVGYHIDSVVIMQHLVAGTFRSITGHFVVACLAEGSRRKVDIVFPSTPFIPDSMRRRLVEENKRALSIDEMLAEAASDDLFQLSAAGLIVTLIKSACDPSKYQPMFALSLWRIPDGNFFQGWVHVDPAKFAELVR